MKSYEVLDALERTAQFKTGDTAPHLLLREVRNGTGFKRRERYADGVLVSLFPSRGVWLAGIEVKVARGDWLSELKNAEKSAEIQQWCKYWWLASAEGVAKEDEIPDAWGWVEVSAKGKVKIRKKAPALKPKAPTLDFLASILRNRVKAEDDLCFRAVRDALEEARKETASYADISNLKNKASQFEDLEKAVRVFCDASGESIHDLRYGPEKLGRARSLAIAIIGGRYSYRASVPADLRKLADDIEEAELVSREAQKEVRKIKDGACEKVVEIRNQIAPPLPAPAEKAEAAQ